MIIELERVPVRQVSRHAVTDMSGSYRTGERFSHDSLAFYVQPDTVLVAHKRFSRIR